MDFNKLSLFTAMKKRLSWLTQRQKVLSQNIANADTPGYRPRDLKPMKFEDMVRREDLRLKVSATNADHLPGSRDNDSPHRVRAERRPYETAPAGNAVVLEEQVMKMNETGLNHRLTTELYKKQIGMIKAALGKR